MDAGGFTLRWDDEPRTQTGGIISEEVISTIEAVPSHYSLENNSSHLSNEGIPIPDTDQIAAENLIFLAQDIVGQINNYGEPQQFNTDVFTVEQVDMDYNGEIECQVTEEVITDDWVQPCGQERVEVPLEQLALANIEALNEGNDDVPLPTDQDEYTAMRPYPCDFCSRRFRKKANLMNHMVAHQNDRPFGCNLCGARYVRRCDLLNHLKVHAFVPEDAEDDTIEDIPKKKSKRKSMHFSNFEKSSTYSDKTAVAARTQQYEGSGSGSTNMTSLRITFEATDPSRPFVCQHCGVGFAREKALASHARIHGGDSPIECSVCGELCWSRENLISHTHSRHPHKIPTTLPSYDEDYASSEESAPEDDEGSESWVELQCKVCGAGFQRADLLQRHIRAAHSYMSAKKDDLKIKIKTTNIEDIMPPENDANLNNMNHACSVCGENFRDALELLAHAESHARGRNNRCVSCGEKCADSDSMARHISTAHPDLPPNTCLFCGRTCKDERSLSNHISAQHDSFGRLLFCSKCGKSFTMKARLKRHMASHRDKAVTCNVCGESFVDGRSLMNHRHSHKGSSSRQFPCHECGKTFGSRSSQQIHIRIHTGERPYGCRFCWKAFADGGTLRKHERIHTGEKPYACAVCPRAFNQRVVLREHVRSHHSGPDARHGTGLTPYWCPVCDNLMSTSVELVNHIVQHCDNNTALKRQPQVGPRKYKRRCKVPSNNLKSSPLNIANESDENISDAEIISPSSRKRSPLRKTRDKTPDMSLDENDFSATFSRKSNESNVGGSARTKGKLKSKRQPEISLRPKMIHTQRAKPSDTEGAVTRRKGRGNITIVNTNITIDERVRPRTKNVTYHEGVERLPAATFPSPIKPEPENDIAADLRAILKDPPVSRDIESTSNANNVKCEPSEEIIVEEDSSLIIKEELDDSLASSQNGIYRCEMCCINFSLRSDLVNHVRIHI